ncbi:MULTISPECIES: gephyrin-like molybdotransferase Glp [unclassified Microbacterium]|uniref:molybdopterin molybdotransferase MoeA n=1 Tax=unclassified Microbacterium TaxID=2609290 RepID=UPI000EA85CFB|nr:MULTISPECIES: gephyrin-like molybdotransferase Glp [unclassified Microbacterium]MBT2484391.1 molybdopterin molybdotransferase MoeA [Microbacterium sp. ISL-108]RKN67302.1 molybdopterin molybdenumtransferase MoeA [Microbacterium sp. CGR2]
MNTLRTVEDQLARVLDAVRVLPGETRPVRDAAGRTLAHSATAAHDIPPFDNSAMDGFAVRAADVATASEENPVRLRVIADLPAGVSTDPPLDEGEAARIMTGSPTPTAADTIVPFEDTVGGLADSLGEVTVLRSPAKPNAFVRRRGADLQQGDEVVPAGERLGAFQLAAAVAAGISEVAVTRAPRVAVISTGSELLTPGEPPARGRIPDSNGPLLAQLVTDADAEVVLVARMPDDADAVRTVTADAVARGVDVIVFTGGVSAGAYEPVRGAFDGGGQVEFAPVAMQPGKPQAFGVLTSGALVFGLPGNPVSVAVSFEVFVRPALLALQGRADIHRPRAPFTADTAWTTPPGRRQYLPAVVDLAAGTVRPATAGGSGSHLAGGLARAHAFAIVPADIAAVAVGDVIDVMLVG